MASGKLFICPTPIGNLEDITLRVIRTLKEADVIACEDTRDSKKLLNHLDVRTPLTSYHEHNRKQKGPVLIDMLLSGKNVALISDAGMPGISDPGEDLVALCIENGVEYTVLPGASASVVALVMSGLPTGRFVFEGFLPRTGRERKERLAAIGAEQRTCILYESPHHLTKTLEDLKNLPGKRRLTLIREISKIYEEKIYTDTESALALFEDTDPRGEFVLVLEGLSDEDKKAKRAGEFADLTPTEHVGLYEKQGLKRNDAIKEAAKDLGISKRDMYKMVQEAKDGEV